MDKQLRDEVRRQRAMLVKKNGKDVPGSIELLRRLVDEAKDPLERDDLLSELSGEYLRAGLEDEHLLVQRERLASHPDAAVLWIALADTLSSRSDSAEEAKQAIARAVEIARRDDALVRYALTVQAQVARKLKDAQLFESALKALIADAGVARQEDGQLESQIVEDLPEGFCSEELQQAYRRASAG